MQKEIVTKGKSGLIDCIKFIALFSMFIDHTNSVLLPALIHKNYFILSGFGRIAYPFFILSFLLSLQDPEKDYQKRFKKILLWTLIAWPAHYLCFNSYEPDILIVFASVLIIRKLDFSFGEQIKINAYPSILFKTGLSLLILSSIALATRNHNYGWAGLTLFLSGVSLVTYKKSIIGWIGFAIGLITVNFAEAPTHPLYNNTLYMIGILKYEIIFLVCAIGIAFSLNEVLPDKRWLPKNIALPFYAFHLYAIAIVTILVKHYHIVFKI